MKNYRILLSAVAVMALAACSRTNAVIEGTAPAGVDTLYLSTLNVNVLECTDTIVVKDGAFSVKVRVEAQDPLFMYLSSKTHIFPALLVQPSDHICVALGSDADYSVSGSEESARLRQIDLDYNGMNATLDDLSARLASASSTAERTAIRKEFSEKMLEHYRSSIRHIYANSHYLSSIVMLNQTVGPYMDVFDRPEDAIHYRALADSLLAIYPQSRYVKSLDAEAKARMNIFALRTRIAEATPAGYIDISLPDVKAEKVSLSSVVEANKVVLLHFWRSADASGNIFNTEVLQGLWKDYHARGLEVYAVSLDIDKSVWARAIKDQKLPWINVCDGLGSLSPVLSTYGITTLPTTLILGGGDIITDPIPDEKALRRLLDKLLK